MEESCALVPPLAPPRSVGGIQKGLTALLRAGTQNPTGKVRGYPLYSASLDSDHSTPSSPAAGAAGLPVGVSPPPRCVARCPLPLRSLARGICWFAPPLVGGAVRLEACRGVAKVRHAERHLGHVDPFGEEVDVVPLIGDVSESDVAAANALLQDRVPPTILRVYVPLYVGHMAPGGQRGTRVVS